MAAPDTQDNGREQPGSEPHRGIRRRSAERRDCISREGILQRVLAEFREMPCLRLTPAQAQRLFGLRPDVSSRVIETLIRDGHVRLDPDGRFTACEPP